SSQFAKLSGDQLRTTISFFTFRVRKVHLPIYTHRFKLFLRDKNNDHYPDIFLQQRDDWFLLG
ncbi:MAG: hypothetical protein AAGJ18_30890, partial [Bacteroidota bacterium]